MLIELFLGLPVIVMWWRGMSLLPSFVVLSLSVALAMWPPQWLLDRLSKETGGGVLFRFGDVLASVGALVPTVGGRIPVYLTMDDAPTQYTHHILRALAECGDGRALFFVIGDYARAEPKALAAIVRAGHALGNHDSANRLTAAPWRSQDAMREGLVSCATTIQSLLQPLGLDARLRWFRPGCGLYTSRVLSVARELQYQTLLGNVYAHDCQLVWWPAFLRWFYPRRVAAQGAHAIVILHDGTEQRALNTAAVIREMYAKANVQFMPMPTLPLPTEAPTV